MRRGRLVEAYCVDSNVKEDAAGLLREGHEKGYMELLIYLCHGTAKCNREHTVWILLVVAGCLNGMDVTKLSVIYQSLSCPVGFVI